MAGTASLPGRVGRESILESKAGWLGSSRGQSVLAFALYALLAVAFFGSHVVFHLRTACVCGGGAIGDPGAYMWFLSWWPHALLGGHNPFFTDQLFAPLSLNLGSVTLVPGAAILMTPITLLFGPLVSWNLAMLAAPTLAAFFAFLLCRYVSRSFPAALVGGYVFGFSSYVLGHMLGHLDLVLTFPIPAVVLLVLLLVDGRIERRRFIALLTLLFVVEFLSSQELTLTLVLLGGLALALAYALSPAHRPHIRLAVEPVLIAGLIAALAVSPFIYYSLTGKVNPGVFNNDSNTYGADALGFLFPTSVTAIHYFPSVARGFTGNIAEDNIYLGLPLLLVVAWYGVTRWRLPGTRIAIAVLVLIVVLLFGSHLHVAGHQTVPLPWDLVSGLPLLHEVIPGRFSVYLFLVAALIVAAWLGERGNGRFRLVKWSVATLVVLALLPNPSWRWQSDPRNPPLFTTSLYKSVFHKGETVLALPFSYYGDSMLLQAETQMHFRLAGGYLGPLWPTNYVLDSFVAPAVSPDPDHVLRFLEGRHVGAVVIDPAAAGPWPQVLTTLGMRGRLIGGALVYDVRGAHHA